MSAPTGVNEVKKNILSIYERRRSALFALSLFYAGLAINYFRESQPSGFGVRGKFWTNQTNQARDRMFTDAFIEDNVVGWFMAHGVQYGTYLELANNRQNEAIRPIIQRFAGRFFRDVKKIYGDES